jgi:hypothetical protein
MLIFGKNIPSSLQVSLGLIALLTLVTACGHTIIRSDSPGAKIYLDGELLGKGEVDIKRTGLPGSAEIKVKHNGQTVSRTISRKFTLSTLFTGFFSLYTGWIWGWQYPEEVYIRAPGSIERTCSLWDRGCSSPWDRGLSEPKILPEGDSSNAWEIQ